MKIRRLLVVPVSAVIDPDASQGRGRVKNILRTVKQRFSPTKGNYDGELQFYADIPKILGKENALIHGVLWPHLHARTPKDTPYPSCHQTPDWTEIRSGGLEQAIQSVDAVLISTRAEGRGEDARFIARKLGKPIALFDFRDHEENYGAEDIRKNLTYDFSFGRDYDLYFKKDLPKGYATEVIRAVAPIPVRPESYAIPSRQKDISVFYSGRPRPGCQADREEAIALVREYIPESVVVDQSSDRSSFMSTAEYWKYLSRAVIALSPSGKVWDSFRNTEVALAPDTAIMLPRPYTEVVGPAFEHGVNTLLYDVEFRDGKYHLKDSHGFITMLKEYLSRPEELKKIAARWAADVRAGHTVLARSRYIIQEMERVLSR